MNVKEISLVFDNYFGEMKRKYEARDIAWSLIIISLIISFLLLVSISFAQASIDVIFAWDANPEEDLAGYRLYRSSVSQIYPYGDPNWYINIPADVTQYTLMSYAYAITQYFVLTAYDTLGNESDPSNEVNYTLDTETPAAPQGFTITININIDR